MRRKNRRARRKKLIRMTGMKRGRRF